MFHGVRCRFFAMFVSFCVFFSFVQLSLVVNQWGTGAAWRNSVTSQFKPRFRSPGEGRHQTTVPHTFPEGIQLPNRTKLEPSTESNPFVSPFHRHWRGVDCAAIIAGNIGTTKQTNRLLKNERLAANGSLPVPPDAVVTEWTRDCERYRHLRHYPTRPLSEEEAGYPVAYTMVVHRDAAQVERLLRSIYHPQNLYCIHADAKSPCDFQLAIRNLANCFENVFIASKTEIVQYAGYTRLLADINCMRDLTGSRAAGYHWKYVINLCGQDFPLKTNLEIVRQLRAYKSHNDINGVLPPPYIKGRTRYHYNVGNATQRRPQRTNRVKSPPPHNMTVYFGNAYIAATRRFVEYLLTSREGADLLAWSNDTYSPDEHFWVTLHRAQGTPGGYPIPTWDGNVRFMKWADVPKHPPCRGIYVRVLCVFGVGYLNYLATQPYLFANKFYYSYDPVTMQCLEELLHNRTQGHNGQSYQLQKFPVTSLVWQNNIAP